MSLCFIGKNVAADIASQLCDSVAKKLEGKVMGTFTSKYIYYCLGLCFKKDNIVF